MASVDGTFLFEATTQGKLSPQLLLATFKVPTTASLTDTDTACHFIRIRGRKTPSNGMTRGLHQKLE